MSALSHNKDYGDCPRKAEARHLTVVEAYRRVFNRQAIPQGRQLVALCGPMTVDGKLRPLCDLKHMVDFGLIKSKQYIGIELDERIHQANVQAVRDVKLLQGEISEVMSELLRTRRLNPEVVNLDTINEPPKAAVLLGKVLDVLNYVDGPTMVVWNTVLHHRLYNRRHTWQDVTKAVQADALCKLSLDLGEWSQAVGETYDVETYEYDGTGRSSTTMGTVIWVRKGKALCSPWD